MKSMVRVLVLCWSLLALAQQPEQPLRVAVAGLEHGHVDGFFRVTRNRTDVQIVGIFDPDPALHRKYKAKYSFADQLFFTDLNTMLGQVKPEAVASFTSTYGHLAVVQAAAPRHIPVMMEKPLATDMDQARGIEKAAAAGKIPIVVNYETTWYRSNGEIHRLFKDRAAAGAIRRMAAMDGHQGPKEIGVGPEFLSWLTDPAKNGAGALFDFGCYGANLMTWMMDNQRPLAVTAMVHTDKPAIYARVDDEATVLVQYPQAQGVIEGSWNWPFARKDFEVYGETGYAVATGGDNLKVRLKGQKEEPRDLDPLPPDERDSVSYLKAVVRGRLKPAGLSSLENNLIVVEILQAARESARTGKTIRLKP